VQFVIVLPFDLCAISVFCGCGTVSADMFECVHCESDSYKMNVQEEEGWWEGNLNGKVGMFPSNFVVILEAEEAEKLSNVIFLICCLELFLFAEIPKT